MEGFKKKRDRLLTCSFITWVLKRHTKIVVQHWMPIKSNDIKCLFPIVPFYLKYNPDAECRLSIATAMELTPIFLVLTAHSIEELQAWHNRQHRNGWKPMTRSEAIQSWHDKQDSGWIPRSTPRSLIPGFRIRPGLGMWNILLKWVTSISYIMHFMHTNTAGHK